jgi:hypothetical protein
MKKLIWYKKRVKKIRLKWSEPSLGHFNKKDF